MPFFFRMSSLMSAMGVVDSRSCVWLALLDDHTDVLCVLCIMELPHISDEPVWKVIINSGIMHNTTSSSGSLFFPACILHTPHEYKRSKTKSPINSKIPSALWLRPLFLYLLYCWLKVLLPRGIFMYLLTPTISGLWDSWKSEAFLWKSD